MKPMLRIGLTQRVDVVPSYRERRDGLDQRWGLLIEEIGHLPVPFCNALRDPTSYLKASALDAIILTGGNDIAVAPNAQSVATERDKFETSVISHAMNLRLPLLAVCRGFQMLNHVLGGKLSPVTGHVAKGHVISENEFGITDVNSFHGFGISSDGLAQTLMPLATAPDGTIEAARHVELPWTCIMWHPEREVSQRDLNVRLVRAAIEVKTSKTVR